MNCHNLNRLLKPGLAGAKRARGWTFWGWIVPIVNLWFPFQLMGDIPHWRAGPPAERRGGGAGQHGCQRSGGRGGC